MSLSLTPSKRQHSHNNKDLNGKKFQKTSSFDSPKEPRKTSSGEDVFRALCPSSKIESLVDQVESILTEIRQETGAKVRVDDPIPGCDERVIFIMGPDLDAEKRNEENSNDSREPETTKGQVDSEDHIANDNDNPNNIGNVNDNDNGNLNNNDNDCDKQKAIPTGGDEQLDKRNSSVQRALLLVLEKFVAHEKQTEVASEEINGSANITFRLLVLSSQVGCLLGRGGSIIKQMSTASGAQIRILPRDKLSQCASSEDDVVQIIGEGDAVKIAIKAVSDQILENTNVDHELLPSNSPGPAFHAQSNPTLRSESLSTRPLPTRGPAFSSGFRDNTDIHPNVPPFFPKFHDNIMPSRLNASDVVTFRLLCPSERVGGIIGKGGAIIKNLQHETGCEIKVLEGTSDAEERIIVISGQAHPADKISVVQDAVLRILHRIAKAVPDGKEKGIVVKFLIPSNQIGCLLGKGGSIIGEMRKVTGAFIRVLGKDQLPKSESEDEVIQINGEIEVVREAVLHITARLQHHFFRDAFPSAFSDRGPPFASYMGRRELSPRSGPSFRNFDRGPPPFHGGLHPHDDHPPFMCDVNRQGMPERPWPPQALIEGGPMGMLDFGGPHQRRIPGFGGERQQPIITNTTVEVVVPSSVIPSIRGEDGGCLRQIRQISDASIIINDPRPGVPETLIIISGTPEQTHAAQSLIQAFVMIENESC